MHILDHAPPVRRRAQRLDDAVPDLPAGAHERAVPRGGRDQPGHGSHQRAQNFPTHDGRGERRTPPRRRSSSPRSSSTTSSTPKTAPCCASSTDPGSQRWRSVGARCSGRCSPSLPRPRRAERRAASDATRVDFDDDETSEVRRDPGTCNTHDTRDALSLTFATNHLSRRIISRSRRIISRSRRSSLARDESSLAHDESSPESSQVSLALECLYPRGQLRDSEYRRRDVRVRSSVASDDEIRREHAPRDGERRLLRRRCSRQRDGVGRVRLRSRAERERSVGDGVGVETERRGPDASRRRVGTHRDGTLAARDGSSPGGEGRGARPATRRFARRRRRRPTPLATAPAPLAVACAPDATVARPNATAPGADATVPPPMLTGGADDDDDSSLPVPGSVPGSAAPAVARDSRARVFAHGDGGSVPRGAPRARRRSRHRPRARRVRARRSRRRVRLSRLSRRRTTPRPDANAPRPAADAETAAATDPTPFATAPNAREVVATPSATLPVRFRDGSHSSGPRALAGGASAHAARRRPPRPSPRARPRRTRRRRRRRRRIDRPWRRRRRRSRG